MQYYCRSTFSRICVRNVYYLASDLFAALRLTHKKRGNTVASQ
ncbi:MAG: hypothetical protein ACI81P_000996 [Neolewinella sp.]|jgi:hypothetical protein